MPDLPEFRIGDVTPDLTDRSTAKPVAAPELDADAFPTLAEFLRGSAPEFRERLDRLAGRAREESSPDAQTALQVAVRLLPELYSKYGG